MAADNTTVHLDLDALERESVRDLPKAKKDPYFVVAGGKRITFRDPVELNYTVLATLEQTPGRFFKAAIADPDEYKHFVEWANDRGDTGTQGLNGFKLRALTKGYRDYYGLDELGNVAGS